MWFGILVWDVKRAVVFASTAALGSGAKTNLPFEYVPYYLR